MRGDLADLRLADQVFAPHYAQAMPCRVVRSVALLDKPKGDTLASLAAGESFDLLELAGGHGWGMAVGPGLVGYVDRTALELK